MSSKGPEDYQRVGQIRKLVEDDFMRRQNVVACGVGFKMVAGQELLEPCVKVSVSEKKPISALAVADIIPENVDGVPTDVVETGQIEAYGLDRKNVLRPLRPGISIGHRGGTAGTLGAVVERGGQRYILSANHVLALLNEGEPGDPIYQPGPSDGGDEKHTVAVLAEYIPIRFGEGAAETAADAAAISAQAAEPQGCSAILATLLSSASRSTSPQPTMPVLTGNQLDAALARPVDGITLNPDIVDLGGPPSGITHPLLGMKVVKSGRTSGLTEGQIVQTDVTVDVRFGGRTARFHNQMMTTPISSPGDSGSLVLDFERGAVGLLFSGSTAVSICTPIQVVLSALNVTLVTG